MWHPSFNLVPAELVCDARSLPARSTKFCIQENKHYHFDFELKYFNVIKWFSLLSLNMCGPFIPQKQQESSIYIFPEIHVENFQLSEKQHYLGKVSSEVLEDFNFLKQS
jgi:hypothetical protein